MTRERLLGRLADLILQVNRSHPLRVAIDGIDTAGKTTLADELVPTIERRGHPVLRASLDGFHRSRAERYRRGEDSPEGYYFDSFNYDTLIDVLLHPLGPGGDRRCRIKSFDFHTDTPLQETIQHVSEESVLLLDGVFLLRPELNPYWDYRVFLQVDFPVALHRAIRRDQAIFGSLQAVEQRYRRRYLPAQRRYLQTVRPQQLADVIIENNNPDNPQIITNQKYGLPSVRQN
jgi:uridine kinase